LQAEEWFLFDLVARWPWTWADVSFLMLKHRFNPKPDFDFESEQAEVEEAIALAVSPLPLRSQIDEISQAWKPYATCTHLEKVKKIWCGYCGEDRALGQFPFGFLSGARHLRITL
jgi:hypothetical protein